MATDDKLGPLTSTAKPSEVKSTETKPSEAKSAAPAKSTDPVLVDGFGRRVHENGSFVRDADGNVVREWRYARVKKDNTVVGGHAPGDVVLAPGTVIGGPAPGRVVGADGTLSAKEDASVKSK